MATGESNCEQWHSVMSQKKRSLTIYRPTKDNIGTPMQTWHPTDLLLKNTKQNPIFALLDFSLFPSNFIQPVSSKHSSAFLLLLPFNICLLLTLNTQLWCLIQHVCLQVPRSFGSILQYLKVFV